MKKSLQSFVMLLALLLPATTNAHDFEVDGMFYNIISDNEVSVTHQDEYYNKYTGDVVIPATVTCDGITYFVTTIGSNAFAFCFGLTSIDIPNSVTIIDDGAFDTCYGLTSITIPNSVTSIGNFVFYGCSGLTSVDIPNSVTTIGESVFEECSGLTSVTIPNTVTTIDNYVFGNCSSLTSVIIPNSVTSIGNYAFGGCSSLTSVAIPNSVTTIDDEAFRGCSSLASIIVESGNTQYDSRDNCNAIIHTATNTLIAGCKNTVIPNSVTTIGGWTFYCCSDLTSIDIPNSVTTIGSSAFAFCSGLTSVTIRNSVTSIGKQAFYQCPAIETVTCTATTPPSMNGIDVFSNNVYIHAPLYVPRDSKQAYMADQYWGQFTTILGIQEEVLATGITLNKPQVNLLIGGTSQLIATVLPDSTTNKVVTWASSDPSVANVNNEGLVTALAPGTTAITAMTTDGSNLSASCLVFVNQSLKGDVNEDGVVDITDATMLINYLLSGVWQ